LYKHNGLFVKKAAAEVHPVATEAPKAPQGKKKRKAKVGKDASLAKNKKGKRGGGKNVGTSHV
jgi:hypothetical protein